MLTTPQEYVDSLDSPGKEWLAEFLDYMAHKRPDIEPVMLRQRPMFKVGKSYLMFTAAKEHFSLHTLNFDLIDALKSKLKGANFGKGCVKIKFSDTATKPVLYELCDEVVRLNLLPDAPEVDVVPDLPYDVKLTNAFSGGKAKWLPLYELLRNSAKKRLPEFIEYFPAVNVLWKHTSTFAQISAVTGALRVEFYSDCLHPEWNAVKTLQTSKNRVAHTVEVTSEAAFDILLRRIDESYTLTKKGQVK